MSYRFRFGYNETEDQAKKGRLHIKPGFCACSNCHAPKFNFGACHQFNSLVGRAAAVEFPAVRPVPGALPAVMEIPRFVATLKVGEFRAIDVARDEVYKEGAPFLALPHLGACSSALCSTCLCRLCSSVARI
jgi:hypothetical protein